MVGRGNAACEGMFEGAGLGHGLAMTVGPVNAAPGALPLRGFAPRPERPVSDARHVAVSALAARHEPQRTTRPLHHEARVDVSGLGAHHELPR